MNLMENGLVISENTYEWERFSQWIHCMCVVTFDLSLGQVLEYLYPPKFTLTEQEITNICYLAFPDSNSSCMGDSTFHVRLRISPDYKRSNKSIQFRNYNSLCSPIIKADDSHYWGYVYFRQKRDANFSRGYFQKSFVLVTRLPFINLYYKLLNYLAPKYFINGDCVLIDACKEINEKWPDLQVDMLLNLPLFEYVYQIFIPSVNNRKFGSQKVLDPCTSYKSVGACVKLIPSVNELELFHSLFFMVEHLYTLWEIVLTAEPLVVIADSPSECSHMVQTLVALIAPLEYCAEYRPYFTIHDSEFKEFTREQGIGQAPLPIILGVTNPFFIKILKRWPHLLRLGNMQRQLTLKCIRNSSSVTSNSVDKHISDIPLTNNGRCEGFTPGLHTKYKPFLKKDKSLIKKVILGMKTKRPENVQTALIRRNLIELTQSFMIPLERYMASLMPLQKDINPFKSVPNAKIFKIDEFIATLDLTGPHLTSSLKGNWEGLYRKFYNSCNFCGWYNSRYKELQLTLQDYQLQALSEANLKKWAEDKHEVEIIDMILKLKQKLNIYNNESFNKNNSKLENSNTAHDQIRVQIDCMKSLLPKDLKEVINL